MVVVVLHGCCLGPFAFVAGFGGLLCGLGSLILRLR